MTRIETLDFVYSTMDAGKSARLLLEAHTMAKKGESILIFKPEQDTRDGGQVKSRAINEPMDAIVVPKGNTGKIRVQAGMKRPRAIFVDEVQFFNSEQIDELGRIVDLYNIPVRCFGLLTNFKGELFEGSRRLMEIADNRTAIETECSYCYRPAVKNVLFGPEGPILEGDDVKPGDEEYVIMCRKCYRMKITDFIDK